MSRMQTPLSDTMLASKGIHASRSTNAQFNNWCSTNGELRLERMESWVGLPLSSTNPFDRHVSQMNTRPQSFDENFTSEVWDSWAYKFDRIT